MLSYSPDLAFAYYDEHINRPSRFELLEERNLPVAGSIHPIDWELFAALLTNDEGQGRKGSDLKRHEVKSALIGNSFEYQYHLHGGRTKLDSEETINHLFISYSPDYQSVVARLIPGTALARYFGQWRDPLAANYEGETRRQRFRRSIPYRAVVEMGIVLIQIEEGRLVGGASLLP